MKKKGSAFNLLATVVLLTVLIYFGLGALGIMSKSQLQNCAVNASGGIENCSLSNSAFYAMNSTETTFLSIFQAVTFLPLLFTVFIIISFIFFVFKVLR